MKEWFSVFLVLVTSAAAAAAMVWIERGHLGPPGRPPPSGTVAVSVHTDTALVGLDAILTVEGPATIVGALDKATAASYGWDSGFTYDPVLPGPVVEIGAGNFGGAPGPIVGFYLIHWDGVGDVTATLTAGTGYGGSMDISYGTPEITGSIRWIIPEPMTIGLLGLGGLGLLRRRR